MASLDDFFAKKDKRKKGKNKNFVTSESLARTIEEHQTPQLPPVEQESSKVKLDLPAIPTQEDEWKEEEEQVQDLEGLRVQKLDKDSDQESENVQVKAEEDEDGIEGESRSKEASTASPWQTVTVANPQKDTTSQDDPEPEHDTLPEQLPNVQGNVYVPPANRGGGGGGGAYVPPGARGSGAYVPPHAKRGAGGGGGGGGGAYIPPSLRGGGGKGSRAPPDLKSAVAFPSLQDTAKKGEGSSTEKGADFKEVQGSKTSRASDASYHAPGLELTNKFAGLEDD